MAAPTTAAPRPRLLHRKVTEAQREAARRNGARSCGPRTSQGKLHSSRNARKHGLFAKLHVFSGQEQREFRALLLEYLDCYEQAGPSELGLVYRLAFADYQRQRAAAVEASLLSRALHETRDTVDQFDLPADDSVRLAVAWESLHNESNILGALSRFEARYSRLYHRTFTELHAQTEFVERTRQLPDLTTPSPPLRGRLEQGFELAPEAQVFHDKTMKRTPEMLESQGSSSPALSLLTDRPASQSPNCNRHGRETPDRLGAGHADNELVSPSFDTAPGDSLTYENSTSRTEKFRL